MNPKKALTGAERKSSPSYSCRQKNYNAQSPGFTLSKLAPAHERALGRARSQRFRDNEKLKKINGRHQKYGLPKLTLKLMREGATGPSVPLATHSATTEESVVTRPSRRSSRLYALRENTQDVKTEVKTEDSPERLTVSFKFDEDKMRRKASMLKKAQRDLPTAQHQLWKLQNGVSHGEPGVGPDDSSSSPELAICQSSNTDSSCGRADVPIRADDISPCKTPTTLKRQILGVAVLTELKKFTHRSKSKVVRRLMTSDEVRKSRSVSALGKEMQMRRHQRHTTSSSGVDERRVEYTTLQNEVLQFLKRPDKSTCMPGKRDTVTIAKTKYQMYVLQDYMEVLHRK